jgi:hypothetical protein
LVGAALPAAAALEPAVATGVIAAGPIVVGVVTDEALVPAAAEGVIAVGTAAVPAVPVGAGVEPELSLPHAAPISMSGINQRVFIVLFIFCDSSAFSLPFAHWLRRATHAVQNRP